MNSEFNFAHKLFANYGCKLTNWFCIVKCTVKPQKELAPALALIPIRAKNELTDQG